VGCDGQYPCTNCVSSSAQCQYEVPASNATQDGNINPIDDHGARELIDYVNSDTVLDIDVDMNMDVGSQAGYQQLATPADTSTDSITALNDPDLDAFGTFDTTVAADEIWSLPVMVLNAYDFAMYSPVANRISRIRSSGSTRTSCSTSSYLTCLPTRLTRTH
jgi:hypothetical protein